MSSSELVSESKDDPQPPRSARNTLSSRKRPKSFGSLSREAQLAEFFQWLPADLHEAPRIDWTLLPTEIMRYLARGVGKNSDAPFIALAAAATARSMGTRPLRITLTRFAQFLESLRTVCHMEQIADLRQDQIWEEYATQTPRTMRRLKWFQVYSALSGRHLPGYLQRLDPIERVRVEQYALPPIPPGYLRRHGGAQPLEAAAREARKAQSDIVVPLYPVLRQLIRLRKQVAERTFKAIRAACQRVEEGLDALPVAFEHTDLLPMVNKEATTISEVQIQGRQVTMSFILWNKRSWVLHHQESYHRTVLSDAKGSRHSYSAEKDRLFVEYVGDSRDCLWFGELLEQQMLRTLPNSKEAKSEEDRRAIQLAEDWGFTGGCVCRRPDMLNSADIWFRNGLQAKRLLFEPEVLYRAILYAAALAVIALSNGSRVSELLQVSFDRRMTHLETVTVVGADGQPILGADGQVATRQVKMHLQYLLPKGAKTDEERQLFPLSKEAVKLLGEIKRGLEAAHGEIPVVHPTPTSAKYEHLKPERYFFQWGASPDGRLGLLDLMDVEVLLRFILHGLELYTAKGEPIRVTVHLLRHVMATDARQYRRIPPEAIAYFFLHHRLQRVSGTPIPLVSDYYWQMPQEQQLALIREYLDEYDEQDRALILTTPTPRDLEQMNEDLRTVYELWHTLHPTALGFCGCPGLCPRGYNRSLCIGCSYLVTDPDRLSAALAWRASYAKQAEDLEAQGNTTDARQVRLLVQQLDDHITVMRLQQQVEADGKYMPLFKLLPKPAEGWEASDEEDL